MVRPMVVLPPHFVTNQRSALFDLEAHIIDRLHVARVPAEDSSADGKSGRVRTVSMGKVELRLRILAKPRNLNLNSPCPSRRLQPRGDCADDILKSAVSNAFRFRCPPVVRHFEAVPPRRGQ